LGRVDYTLQHIHVKFPKLFLRKNRSAIPISRALPDPLGYGPVSLPSPETTVHRNDDFHTQPISVLKGLFQTILKKSGIDFPLRRLPLRPGHGKHYVTDSVFIETIQVSNDMFIIFVMRSVVLQSYLRHSGRVASLTTREW